jgi:protein arginine N-methyltransferase 1/protein arginine N-methyltransferase 3
VDLAPEQLLEPHIQLATLDLGTLPGTPDYFEATATYPQAATAYALVGWFSVELCPGVELGTGPLDAPTHWSQIYFPLPEPFPIQKGRSIKIRLHPPPSEAPDPLWRWSVSDGETSIEVDEAESRLVFHGRRA